MIHQPVFVRRSLQGIAVLAASILGISAWIYFLETPWTIPMTPLYVIAGLAGVAFIVSAIGSFVSAWQKPGLSRTTYVISLAAILVLIHETGSLLSPFLFLWVIVAVFARLFSGWIFLLAGLAGNLLLIAFMVANQSSSDQISISFAIIELPLLMGVVLWSKRHLDEPAEPGTGYVATAAPSEELSAITDSSATIINAIGDGVLTVDAQGVVQLINPAGSQLLGWSKEDAVGLSYKSLFSLYDANGAAVEDTANPIHQVLNTNQEIRSNNYLIETHSGKKIDIGLVISPAGGPGSGVIVAFRDITKEKKEGKEQAEFISTASHEMRTPVASIEGYLGLALNPATATIDDKARSYIVKAHESAQHLGSLFQDLLDVSKADDGRLSNKPRVVNVIEFTGEVVEGLIPKATDKGLELVYQPADANAAGGERHISPVYFAHIDKDHLREIINNLTENAIKYTPSGSVRVNVTGTDDTITLSFADTGIGIPKEDLSHLFQKFYRVDNSDTREIGGTGLGLYLCRRLVETVGGRIWAESEYKKGSTFFVELPRISGDQAARLQDAEANGASSTPAPAEPPLVIDLPGVSGPIVMPEIAPAPVQTPLPQISTPAPISMPTLPVASTPALAPTPVVSAPPLAPPPAPVTPPVAPQPPAPQSPRPTDNLPLSYIEQQPELYTQARRQAISIPVRNDNSNS